MLTLHLQVVLDVLLDARPEGAVVAGVERTVVFPDVLLQRGSVDRVETAELAGHDALVWGRVGGGGRRPG